MAVSFEHDHNKNSIFHESNLTKSLEVPLVLDTFKIMTLLLRVLHIGRIFLNKAAILG